MRLGEARVDEVVDGHDTTKAPPQRRGAREAVHEVDAGVGCQPRQASLLAEHPLDAVARVHRHGHRWQRLPPRPFAGGGLAVDERGEARTLGRLREQRRDQLSRVDLHPSGLAGNQEDEVQTDVHRS